MTYENDTLVIPEKYKKMSVSELAKEEERMLKELLARECPKKAVTPNKRGIVFRF